eukprot:7022758-Pyramimonas_sp.AAC.1
MCLVVDLLPPEVQEGVCRRITSRSQAPVMGKGSPQSIQQAIHGTARWGARGALLHLCWSREKGGNKKQALVAAILTLS